MALSFPIDAALAMKAHKLSKRGLKGKAMSLKLGKGLTTDNANTLASVGSEIQAEQDAALTERETAVLLALAAIQRKDRFNGITSSPKAKFVARRLRLSEAQVRRVTRGRLTTPEFHEWSSRKKLGLLHHSVNGHIWLTAAGWAFVQAIEAALTTAKGGA